MYLSLEQFLYYVIFALYILVVSAVRSTAQMEFGKKTEQFCEHFGIIQENFGIVHIFFRILRKFVGIFEGKIENLHM